MTARNALLAGSIPMETVKPARAGQSGWSPSTARKGRRRVRAYAQCLRAYGIAPLVISLDRAAMQLAARLLLATIW